MQIRAVTLDVGHTLIEPREPVGEVYARAAARHGCTNVSRADLEQRFQVALDRAGSAVNTRADWANIVDATFTGLLPRPPSETFFPQLFRHFGQPEAWRIYDDVWPALDTLAQRGVRLGIISNWDDRLRQLLTELKLAERFEVILISCEFGRAKPAPEIFAAAARAFHLPPARIMHVGDNATSDVAGARAAGFQAVRINRASATTPDQLGSLLELPDVLRGRER